LKLLADFTVQPSALSFGKLNHSCFDRVDFTSCGRTHATLMKQIHDDPKLVADQLGHMVDVNQNVHARVSVERRKVAVDALEKALPMM
jgi:hypothetical protein